MAASTQRAAKIPATSAQSAALVVYLSVIVATGTLVLAHASLVAAHTPRPLGWLMFAALAIVTGSFKLNFAAIAASISVSDTFFITTALLFGPAPATLAIALDSFVICIRRREPWKRLAFNTVAPALSLWVGAQTCFALAGVAPLAEGRTPVGSLALPLLALAVVYFLLNSTMTAIAVALESGQSVAALWRRHFMWLSVGYLAAASAAFCLILLIQQVSLAAAVMVLPLLAVFHLTLRSSFGRLEDAERHLGDLDRLYLSTVETLAMAIDAKDDVTHSHVRRVQAYAVGLARALGVNDEESIKAIEAGALLHDTGKLAVPEHILNKPGKLTDSEFAQMKMHVDVGADILSLVEFPYPVVPIVRCHHENWDGSGYPRGVMGEEIPIGARILSVVDCFDALTSDRPYRRRMTEEAALQILRERRGTMYDPTVVDTFVNVYRHIDVGTDETAEHQNVLRRIAESRTEPRVTCDSATPQVIPGGASAHLLAFVSLARVASGEGGTSDILALSSNLIADMMPEATGAWFLLDAGRVRLTAADAFGPAAHVVRGTTLSVGQRLTGWVAASRQPVVNSDAALDLESVAGQVTPALRSCMSVPLLMGDVLVGVLTLYSADPDAFDENRGRLIQMIAPHIASAIQAAAPGTAAKDVATRVEKAAAATGRELRLVAAR
jgi:putative nucleotidyltransferase with HDIG domain